MQQRLALQTHKTPTLTLLTQTPMRQTQTQTTSSCSRIWHQPINPLLSLQSRSRHLRPMNSHLIARQSSMQERSLSPSFQTAKQYQNFLKLTQMAIGKNTKLQSEQTSLQAASESNLILEQKNKTQSDLDLLTILGS